MNVYEITLLCVIGVIAVIWIVDRFTGGHITEKIIQWHPVLAALTALTAAVSAVLPSSYFATPIGPMDMLIASHARAEGLTLVTNNTRKFNRVEELDVEEWTIA